MRLSQNMIDTLLDLHQLEVDANHAYADAIDRLRSAEIKASLVEFKQEHEGHLSGLESFLKAHGVEAPKRSRDVKGFLIEGMTVLRSAISDEQALKAMKQNETVTNKSYEKALKKVRGENPEAEELLEAYFADEKKHYNYIVSELGESPEVRPPERRAPSPDSSSYRNY